MTLNCFMSMASYNRGISTANHVHLNPGMLNQGPNRLGTYLQIVQVRIIVPFYTDWIYMYMCAIRMYVCANNDVVALGRSCKINVYCSGVPAVPGVQ